MEGNQQKMRVALLKLRAEIGRFHNNEWIPYDDWEECDDVISHALSAPARQCDVGTADEQDARFSRFCVEKRSGSCSGCPDAVGGFTVANGIRECALVWAQTPYAEEGGAA